jgi:hypothetical protein
VDWTWFRSRGCDQTILIWARKWPDEGCVDGSKVRTQSLCLLSHSTLIIQATLKMQPEAMAYKDSFLEMRTMSRFGVAMLTWRKLGSYGKQMGTIALRKNKIFTVPHEVFQRHGTKFSPWTKFSPLPWLGMDPVSLKIVPEVMIGERSPFQPLSVPKQYT